MKHDTDWTLTVDADGSCAWTSPTDRRHSVDPPVYPIDRTRSARGRETPYGRSVAP